ncbi:hypothetical protein YASMINEVIRUS_1046 [Yasminevirus sp. GU-2018]|uniref:Uncharacterized protein n=1 Tax=Yasminevirus sp. GU-2018 TaxID=2420051 RepID=A0A5K0UAT1_9VIRU|nr:hypothetical protein YASMINEVIRUS_1046 [Yasminevirus sp. GU-2018]
MSVRILFVTFYGAIEYVGKIVDTFNDLVTLANNNKSIRSTNKTLDMIDEISYLKYKNDENMTHDQISRLIIDRVNKNKITHIFWFFFPDVNVLKTVREKTKIKNVFYNFEDPVSFNIFLVQNLRYVDYFINPIKRNERKYTYVLGKQVHTVPMYDDTVIAVNDTTATLNFNDNPPSQIDDNVFLSNEDLGTNTIDSDDINDRCSNKGFVNSVFGVNVFEDSVFSDDGTTNTELDSGPGSSLGADTNTRSDTGTVARTDVAILIDDDYTKYDAQEREAVDNYVQKIKNYCIDNNTTLNMYGSTNLETYFPDIYVDTCESLNYFGINARLVIVLDLRTGLDKGTNKLIDRCIRYGVPVLSNSNQVNSTVHERGLKRSKGVKRFDGSGDLPISQCTKNGKVGLITLDNLDIINKTLSSTSQGTLTNSTERDSTHELQQILKTEFLTISEWANKILDVLMYK